MNGSTIEILARRVERENISAKVFYILAVSICLVMTVTGCGESYKERSKHEALIRQERERRDKAKRVQIISELRETFNADDKWNQNSVLWTIDIQDRLIRSDGRPIVGIAKLRDVERLEDSYIIYLVPPERGFVGSPSTSNFDFPLEFVLRCTRPPARPKDTSALSSSHSFSEWFRSLYYPEYAFVATVHRVRKQDVPVVEVLSEDTVLDKRDKWIADGECLELQEITYEKTD